MLNRMLILATLLLSSNMAWAISAETGKITSLSIGEGGYVSVYLDGTDDNSQCSGGARWTLYKNDPMFEGKYSTLLAAYISGKTIGLRHLSSTCGMYSGNIIEMISINLSNQSQ